MKWRSADLRKHRRLLFITMLFITLSGFFLYATYVAAATRTWDGGGSTNNWSDCDNWSSDTCPGAGDIALFDDTSTKDAVVDSGFSGSVLGIDINSGYTGTVTQERNLTLDSSGYNQADGIWKQRTYIFDINDGSFTQSDGTFETGIGTSFIQRNFTLSGGTYTASSTSVIDFDGTNNENEDDTTITCTGELGTLIDFSKNRGTQHTVTLSSGCSATTTTTVNTHGVITNNGTLHLDTPFYVDNGNYVNNGTTTVASGFVGTFERNFTQNGIMDLSDATSLTFFGDGSDNSDNTTLTCTGALGAPINIDKNRRFQSFRLSSACVATTTGTVSTQSPITIDGTLTLAGNFAVTGTGGSLTINGQISTEGHDLTANSGISLGANDTLRLHGDETITSPSIGEDALIEYYGSGTYSSLSAGTNYENLLFSGSGTYNISSSLTVEDDFRSTNNSTFNQTSGTVTLDGTSDQTVTGTSTFANLTATAASPRAIVFGANETTTITNALTLTGNSFDTQLAIRSNAPGTQFNIDPQGTRTVSALHVTDSNNVNVSEITCDTECLSGGNNSNWSIPALRDKYRLEGGVRFNGGARF